MSAQLSRFEPARNHGASTIEAMLAQVTTGRDWLPDGTVLGTHVVQGVVGRDDIAITYRAASAAGEAVEIDEYLPEALARREDDGTVRPRAPELQAAFEAGRRAFVEEAVHLQRDLHPSLLRVLASWQDSGTAYRVRPAHGEVRLDVWRTSLGGAPSVTWLRSLLRTLVAALAELHALSLVHGNVRPGNIAIRPDGVPLLLGFDSARWALADLAHHPEPGYLAIEQTERYGELPVGPWTDAYALGAVAAFVVTGRAPTPAAQRVSAASRSMFAAAVAALRKQHPDADFAPPFIAAIDRALAPLPAQRPRRIEELLLQVGGATVLSPPPRQATFADAGAAEALPVTSAVLGALQPPPVELEVERPRRAGGEAPLIDFAGIAAAVAAESTRTDGDTWRAERPPGAKPPAGRARRRGIAWSVAAVVMLAAGVAAVAWQWREWRGSERLTAMLGRWVPLQTVPAAGTPALGSADQQGAVSVSSEPPPALAAVAPRTPRGQAVAPATPSPVAGTRQHPPAAAAAAAPVVPAQAQQPSAPKPGPKVDLQGAAAETRRLAGTPPLPAEPSSPRDACAPRTNFALYRCMQQQCELDRFYAHEQCVRLRQRDEVS